MIRKLNKINLMLLNDMLAGTWSDRLHRAKIQIIFEMSLNVHNRVTVQILRFGFLRLSTIKNCSHMIRSYHRSLENS